MSRIISSVETLAGLCLAAVALLTFVAVVFRYGLSMNVPDAFDFARYLQGITIMWGLSIATWRGSHISVDIFWEMAPPLLRRAIDIFAASVTAGFFCFLAWQLGARLPGLMNTGQVTSDLRIVIWPFYMAAAMGIVSTALVAVLVLMRTLFAAESPEHG